MRSNGELTTHRAGARFHAGKSAPSAARFRVESGAVIVNGENQPSFIDGQFAVHRSATGVLDCVVDAFLEDEVGCATLVGVHDYVVIGPWGVKSKFDLL